MKFQLSRSVIIGFIACFLVGTAFGVQWHRLYIFPFPQIHDWRFPPKAPVALSEKAVITKYTKKIPVFSDRLYFDSIGDKRLEGLYLVQIPRHTRKNIKINAHKPITIYRFITDRNTNRSLHTWTATKIPIFVRGHTCTHTRVVKKDFPAGMITLHPGGPVASSPILIKVRGHKAPSLAFEALD